jgi:hypothetical protein
MATAEEHYTTNEASIIQILRENFIKPHGTEDEIIADAYRIVKLLLRDGEALVAGGLGQEIVDTLDAKIGCYSFASAKLTAVFGQKGQIYTSWKDGEKDGYTLRREVLHHYEFLYRNNSNALASVANIKSGRGRTDMIQDLLDISVLGKNQSKELRAASTFDMGWLNQCEKLNSTLSNLLAELNTTPEVEAINEKIKMQAYTWLEESLIEIRSYANYIFNGDLEKIEEYKKSYWNN